MAQQIKARAAQVNDLGLTFRIHIVDEKINSRRLSCDLLLYVCMHKYILSVISMAATHWAVNMTDTEHLAFRT